MDIGPLKRSGTSCGPYDGSKSLKAKGWWSFDQWGLQGATPLQLTVPAKPPGGWSHLPEPWEDPKNGSTRKGSYMVHNICCMVYSNMVCKFLYSTPKEY